MEHDFWKSCGRDDCDGGCPRCTIGICKVCGLVEGSLTTDCPEVESYREHGDAIYAGHKDFRGGIWINKPSPHSPASYRTPA